MRKMLEQVIHLEREEKNSTGRILRMWKNIRLRLLAQGIAVGVSSGLVVVFYRLALERAEDLRRFILVAAAGNLAVMALWFAALVAAGLFTGHLIRREPLISGSGIPQVEVVLARKIDMDWVSVLTRKFIGGAVAIGAGLSLGREGPSIQLGAAAGQGLGRIFRRTRTEEKYLITSGASAGLAAAFNAPLAGVMFALEEVHRHFSPLVLLSAMSAALTADLVSARFFGLSPVFHVGEVTALPLEYYGYIIILGIIVAIFGVIFNRSILLSQDAYGRMGLIPKTLRILLPFIIAGILAFLYPSALGGGHGIFDSLMEGNMTVNAILLALAIKYLFTMVCYGSGAPGGIFFPLLVLGALTGGAYGNLLADFMGVDPAFIKNFVILAMAGYFTAIVRSPITGSILITEMTGSFTHLLSLSVISLTAYVVADLMKSEPIYESLLERLLKKGGVTFTGNRKNKVMIEIPVFMDSKLDGMLIKDMGLKSNCLIVNVGRGGHDILPTGYTMLHSGDCITLLVEETSASEVKERLKSLGGSSGEHVI